MKIGILGTGIVGRTLGTGLVRLRHEVMMGSRMEGNPHAVEWVQAAGAGASEGTFAAAARFGEVVFNCTSGQHALEAVALAGKGSLAGKILVDVSNPLDFSHGMPPTLTVCNTNSLGEQIQKAFPEAKVVKALNTVDCAVMVDPSLVPGEHELFLCGNDRAAKASVAELLGGLGWTRDRLVDLGDITAARATEMLLPFWVRAMMKFGHGVFNLHLTVGRKP